MKRRIAACIMVIVMAVSGSGMAEVKAAEAAVSPQENETVKKDHPVAKVLDVDFESKDGTDKSEMQNPFTVARGGSPREITFEHDDELNRPVANFYDYAYVYPFNEEKYAKITDAVTMECMFKYNEFWWGEREVFSNQDGGGIGFGVDNERLIFYAHVGGSYREPGAEISVGEWVHAVGVVDGESVKLYVNGRLAGSVAASGGVYYPSNTNAWNFVIGGDSDSNGGVENFSNVDISLARLYDRALTAEEIELLSEKAFEGSLIEPKAPGVNCGMVSPDTAVAGAIMHVGLHMNKIKLEEVNRASCTLFYDPEKMTYLGVQYQKDGASIQKTADGTLEVVCENLSGDDFRKYASTRLGEILFEIADETTVGTTSLEIGDFRAYSSGTETADFMEFPSVTKDITILAKKELDLNGDGVIGAGDVALAETAAKKEIIAQNAAIYPYKHAVVLTVDGAGNVWNPDEIYYAGSEPAIPRKTRDTEIMAKRTNTYAMELFNKEFAVSYTAQSVKPAISAQNYASILHGVPWEDLEESYRVTNDSAAVEYFADFGKEEVKYPSLFRVAQDADPNRYLAAFSEWKPILEGIIEPDTAVMRKISKSDEGGVKSESFSDVAEYIRGDKYKNTSILYMQNDWMDHTGHSRGYYTDIYWGELAAYDEYYKQVIDALKETGTYDETLIVANADHGGSWWDHGSVYSSDTDIFIGLGGQTIDSGARLTGGTNADIPALVLHGLRMKKPASMTGKVFDKSAFLSQEEMKKKGRDTDSITFMSSGKEGVLTISTAKSEVRAADAILSIGDAQVESVETEGGTVLRQETKDGKLYLTVSYENTPSVLAKVIFQDVVSEAVKTEEIMLGTVEGKEVYPDLTNEHKTEISDLEQAIEAAEKKAKEEKAAAEEAKRKEQEAKDAEAEAKRKEQEAKDAEAEAEESRAAAEREAEAARQKAEAAERAEAEARREAETAKAEAEEAKKEAEAAKTEAENLRRQIQNSAESEGKTKLTVKKTSIKIKVGKSCKIKASATTSHKITFKSDNKKVAKVSGKGVVKGKKKGKTFITVKCNGVTKKVKVIVK